MSPHRRIRRTIAPLALVLSVLPGVVQEITKTIANVELGHVAVIDSGNGQAISGAALARARMLTDSMATLESVLGIDLRSLTRAIAENITSGNGSSPAAAHTVAPTVPARSSPK